MKDMMIDAARERRTLIAIAALVGAVVIFSIVWWGYQQYQTVRNQRAQLLLAEQLERFEALAHNTEALPTMWEDIGEGFERGFNEHARSSLAPFFLVNAAESFKRSGKSDKAIELLDKAVSALDRSSPFYFLYGMKAAVLRLDSSDAELSARGKKELLEIAQNNKGYGQGLAWLHLWEYAFVKGDAELAALAHAKIQTYQDLAQIVRHESEPLSHA